MKMTDGKSDGSAMPYIGFHQNVVDTFIGDKRIGKVIEAVVVFVIDTKVKL